MEIDIRKLICSYHNDNDNIFNKDNDDFNGDTCPIKSCLSDEKCRRKLIRGDSSSNVEKTTIINTNAFIKLLAIDS